MVVPVDVGENLLPRRYQEEIFARAQEGNIIAALDTGSGKTFISTLLMKWVAARHAGDKKIVFLVPKVALVEQQADFIARQTPLRVSRFHGALSIEMTDRTKWRNEFENSDVLVMTGERGLEYVKRRGLTPKAAQIFLNIITHSHWSMEKACLFSMKRPHLTPSHPSDLPHDL
jgi:endoribonuclease Dicer